MSPAQSTVTPQSHTRAPPCLSPARGHPVPLHPYATAEAPALAPTDPAWSQPSGTCPAGTGPPLTPTRASVVPQYRPLSPQYPTPSLPPQTGPAAPWLIPATPSPDHPPHRYQSPSPLLNGDSPRSPPTAELDQFQFSQSKPPPVGLLFPEPGHGSPPP